MCHWIICLCCCSYLHKSSPLGDSMIPFSPVCVCVGVCSCPHWSPVMWSSSRVLSHRTLIYGFIRSLALPLLLPPAHSQTTYMLCQFGLLQRHFRILAYFVSILFVIFLKTILSSRFSTSLWPVGTLSAVAVSEVLPCPQAAPLGWKELSLCVSSFMVLSEREGCTPVSIQMHVVKQPAEQDKHHRL